jgi:hypothetical protein
MLLFIVFMIEILSIVMADQDLAKICKWFGEKSGWYCDDKFSRAIWRTDQKVVHGAKDCNSFCIHLGKSSGECKLRKTMIPVPGAEKDKFVFVANKVLLELNETIFSLLSWIEFSVI